MGWMCAASYPMPKPKLNRSSLVNESKLDSVGKRKIPVAVIAAIAQRELSAYFFSPIAYVVLTVYLVLTGFFFTMTVFAPGEEASLRGMFEMAMPMLLVAVLPLLAMKLLSEEMRSGTIETLMTAPVTELDITLGKFFGVFAFYIVMLAGTLFYAAVIAYFGEVDLLLLISDYIALMLLGALYLSVGLFLSSWTQNQIIAGVGSVVLLLVFTWLTGAIAEQFQGWIRASLQQLTILTHYQEMIRGKMGLDHVVFFLSTTLFFLFMTTKVLESRRWR